MAERPYDWRIREAVVLGRVRVPDLQPLGFVTTDGALQPVSEVVSPAATEQLTSSGLVWANSNHPNQAIGKASSMPVAVALVDGTQVADVLWREEGTLVSLGDIEASPGLRERLQELGIDSSLPRASAETAARSGMQARSDY